MVQHSKIISVVVRIIRSFDPCNHEQLHQNFIACMSLFWSLPYQLVVDSQHILREKKRKSEHFESERAVAKPSERAVAKRRLRNRSVVNH